MIQTKQLSADTIIFQVRGPFHQNTAKEISLLVFRSYRLGFKIFLFDLSQVPLIDAQGSRHFKLIRQGLQDKGMTWRIVSSPPLPQNNFLMDNNVDQLPEETWN